jgi:hypothetical protein
LYKKVNIIVKKPIIFHVVLYGCETWPLTLREEHTGKLKVYENRLLKTIFGPKREEVVGS